MNVIFFLFFLINIFPRPARRAVYYNITVPPGRRISWIMYTTPSCNIVNTYLIFQEKHLNALAAGTVSNSWL